jgi:Tfp pilus assembly protein PilN
MPDRRVMEETRRRVDEIAASMEAYRERLDHRYRRFGYITIASVVLTLIFVVLGFMLLQGQRWEQSRDACLRTNQQTDATVDLLSSLPARPFVIRSAKEIFPHVPPLAQKRGAKPYDGPMSCDEAADERVTGPRL